MNRPPGYVVALRVEQVGLADDAAIAQDQRPVGVVDRERLSRFDGCRTRRPSPPSAPPAARCTASWPASVMDVPFAVWTSRHVTRLSRKNADASAPLPSRIRYCPSATPSTATTKPQSEMRVRELVVEAAALGDGRAGLGRDHDADQGDGKQHPAAGRGPGDAWRVPFVRRSAAPAGARPGPVRSILLPEADRGEQLRRLAVDEGRRRPRAGRSRPPRSPRPAHRAGTGARGRAS